jgi:hypothetical protein
VDVADIAYHDSCVVIEGVVSPRGHASRRGKEGIYDVHSFELAGWRRLGGPFVERELHLMRPIPPCYGPNPEENTFDLFPSCSIQRFMVLLSKDETRAVVESVLTIDKPDEKLLSLSNQLQQPVIISAGVFGELVLNRSVDWFEGEAEWNGEPIKISFLRDTDGAIGDAVTTALILWADEGGWKLKIEDFAVKELLPLKNSSWLEEEESELTEKDFKALMKLEGITVGGDSRFEFFYEDGDMFGGHCIVVIGNLEKGVTHAQLYG